MSHFVIHLKKNDNPSLFVKRAAEVAKEGGIIAYPTDTVYGMGADPLNSEAVRKIFWIKNRSLDQGLPVLVADLEEAKKVGNFSEQDILLAKRFWPGSLTIVVPLKNPSDDRWLTVSGGKNTIALRVPDDPIILGICQEMKNISDFGGITGTSANYSGEPDTNDGKEVVEKFHNILNFIINSGKTKGKLPSTIVTIDRSILATTNNIKQSIRILRDGPISKIQLEEVFEDK